MREKNFLVVGGSGFLGRHLVAALAARGARVTVPARRRERAKHLILLPTVEVVETDVLAPGELEQLVAGRDAVINLAGVLHSRRGRPDERGPNDYGPDFARAHVEVPQAIVNACHASGVRRLLHVSAVGAAPDAPSEYLRSKGVGEKLVLADDELQATVFRPSVVFGPEDNFLNLFARLARAFPVLPLGSPQAQFQPVYVGDVVQAMLASLEARSSAGKRYDLCGPRRYALIELVRLVCEFTGRRRWVVGLPDALSMLQAWFLEWTPGPLMSRDNVRSMQVPSVCDCALPFGIEPTPLEAVAPSYLRGQYTARSRYRLLRWRARR
jgi:uncharacterized protein YbjT (DUF2867 family)